MDKHLAPLFLLEILKREGRRERPLRQAELALRLEEEYGVILERKAVSRNLDLLVGVYPEVRKCGRGAYYEAEAAHFPAFGAQEEGPLPEAPVYAELRTRSDALDRVTCAFGRGVTVTREDPSEGTEAVRVAFKAKASDLIGFCLANARTVELLAPAVTRETVARILREAAERYGG